tara:strand:+ start:68 stop:922 length:855 start_codon:yes stop_codon:yes gene_type:complete
MKHLKIFIELTRLNKPIGFMLLFWPCSWGLAYAYSINKDLNLFIHYLILFFLGSVLMRSAGCIFNDIVDRDFDKKVKRTKTRPIASGKISVYQSSIYVFFLCGCAFLILLQFNFLTILLGLSSMILAFSYPFMKRLTYWPQLFLGITFNWGIIMAYSAVNNHISLEIIVIYISAIFWTLGYDTIYGTQDISDDEIIGLKSTSIKFKKQLKFFISLCYFITFSLIFWIFRDKLGTAMIIFFIFLYLLSLIYQIIVFKVNNQQSCLRAFKINNLTGLFLFMAFNFI